MTDVHTGTSNGLAQMQAVLETRMMEMEQRLTAGLKDMERRQGMQKRCDIATQNTSGAMLCLAGILDKKRIVCCPASCGECGGPYCGSKPGGSDACCGSAIRNPCQDLTGPPPCRYYLGRTETMEVPDDSGGNVQ
eukprot:gnl/TRDRNA2_/TRDRNA2_121616_c0_seq1.p1 gnl/TRDRNA2_/TRDRNA2_121616_c0~~gnl/TRDRNA2_/TRDRNA2_121616_c0_seq1.p1  ORF type:complete len:156 (+),score=24.16 gnl/TRDRNA2_/TRDRNA2_121616_c0_seq1:64-468(+)